MKKHLTLKSGTLVSELLKENGISLNPNKDISIFDKSYEDYFTFEGAVFVGTIELPTKKENELYKKCIDFVSISIESKDKKSYIPVFIMENKNIFFENDKEYNVKPWVVLYLGIDNVSYGKRFGNKKEAMDFVNKGCLASIEDFGYKLKTYNS